MYALSLALSEWILPSVAFVFACLGISAFLGWRSQRRALLEELARQTATMEERNRVKGDFLSMVGHDIRTPLNGIVGMTTLLARSSLDAEQRGMLDQIGRSAEHMTRLVDDLLDVAWLESGRLDVRMGRVDFVEVAEDVVDDLAPRARAKHLALDLHVALDVPKLVRADDVRLRRALRTLVENAIEFTNEGTVIVRLQRASDASRIRCSVVDTGEGMKPETLDRLLRARLTSDDTDASRAGPRLGVRVVRLLVEKMGGHLDVSSAIGSGSVFAFDLAIDETAQTEVTEPLAVRALIASEDLSSRRLLADHTDRLGFRSDVVEKLADVPEHIKRATDAGDPYQIGFIEVDSASAKRIGIVLRELASSLGAPLPPLVAVAPRGADIIMDGEHEWPDDSISRPLGPRRLEAVARQCIAVREGGHERARKSRSGIKAECVLIAEDHETNRLVALGYVIHLGFRGRVVTSGRAAVEAIQEAPESIDAVLLDAEMPDGNGLEATREIRRWEASTGRSPIPIVIVTAHAAKYYEAEAIAAGANAYLRKPVRIEQLGRLLYRLFGRRRDRRSSQPEPHQVLMQTAPKQALDPAILDDLKVLVSSGDKEFLPQLLESYRVSSARIMGELAEALAKRDQDAARKLAHQIKGSSRTLGARALGDIFAELEKAESDASREDAYARASQEMPEAISAFERFTRDVAAR